MGFESDRVPAKQELARMLLQQPSVVKNIVLRRKGAEEMGNAVGLAEAVGYQDLKKRDRSAGIRSLLAMAKTAGYGAAIGGVLGAGAGLTPNATNPKWKGRRSKLEPSLVYAGVGVGIGGLLGMLASPIPRAFAERSRQRELKAIASKGFNNMSRAEIKANAEKAMSEHRPNWVDMPLFSSADKRGRIRALQAAAGQDPQEPLSVLLSALPYIGAVVPKGGMLTAVPTGIYDTYKAAEEYDSALAKTKVG